jgi:hypothetical protein
VAEQNFHASGQLFLAVQGNLRRERSLASLRKELYHEAVDGPWTDGNNAAPQPPPAAGPQVPAVTDPNNLELHMVNEMLQVMEMAWFGLRLDRYHSHPLNRGWMNVFRRWTNARPFQALWPFLRSEYSQEFVRFCERALNMGPTEVTAERLRPEEAALWLRELREMDVEFKQEWAPEGRALPWLVTGRYLRDAVATAYQFTARLNQAQMGSAAVPLLPLVWRLWVTADPSPQSLRRCCGLVCVCPPYRGAGRNLELFAWLRGPYRNAALGRYSLPPILEMIDDEIGPRRAPDGQPYRLLTYYPNGSLTSADRLARLQWMNFYFDYSFRCVPTSAPGALTGALTLARELR